MLGKICGTNSGIITLLSESAMLYLLIRRSFALLSQRAVKRLFAR
ncbi:hypothetical protein TERTU_2143 [Teredinibacter turnerae T7901]|uniref:Uncharacterized protein n=1 Tax=Teredinibacter turnerae (strain ATCC 39867 / T7901) TaxID=377629 RepID=C5BJD4_TERTT|nr:hypothetical protein TERTU_2143 [Teredinibacter turnerae T7901]